MKMLTTFFLTLVLCQAAYSAPQRECSIYESGWEEVDHYGQSGVPAGSFPLTYPIGVYAAKSRSGKVYVTGASLILGGQRQLNATVRYSQNFGRKWNTSSLGYESQTGSLGIRITEAPNGNVLVFQEFSVFSSANHGKDFDLISIFDGPTSLLDISNLLITDSVNVGQRIYVSAVAKGKVPSLNGARRWHGYVLYSDTNGETWNYFDEYFVNEEKETWLTSIAADSNGNIAVSGHWQDAQGQYQPMVVSYQNPSQPNSNMQSVRTDLLTKGRRGNSANRLLILDSGEILVALSGLSSAYARTAYIARINSSLNSVSYDLTLERATSFDITKGLGNTLFYTYTSLTGGSKAYAAISKDLGQNWDLQWGGEVNKYSPSNYSYEIDQDYHGNAYMIVQSGNNNWLVFKKACLRRI